MGKRDYYDVLGVSRQATMLEIRRAYRRLARQYSPDVNVWDDRVSVLFDEITEAYRVLSEPSARVAYDRLGHRAFEPAREDTAEEAVRGEDLHYPMEIDLEEALHGVSAVLEVTRRERCSACQGNGGAQGQGPTACPACDARPILVVTRHGIPMAEPCAVCRGSGRRLPSPCTICGGRGTLPRRARVVVSIPPGVDTGAQVRVPGEGHAAARCGPTGDLVVITRVRPHSFFARKGDHLCCEVPVTVPEAVLGARIQVPTPDGPGVVTVPPGTQSGQVFRIRGKGCPRLDREGRGDLLVTARVTIPRNADSTLEAVLRALQRLLPEDPRAGLWGRRGV